MNNKAKLVFADYTSLFIRPGAQRFAEMWKIRAVEAFLESGQPITRKGIKKYIATLPSTTKIQPSEIEHELVLLLSNEKKKENNTASPQDTPTRRSCLSDTQEQSISKFYDWLTVEKEFSQNTTRSYIQALRDYFSCYAQLTQSDAVSYKQALIAKGLSRKTVNIRLAALSAFGKFLGKNVELKRLKVPRVIECNNVPSEKEMAIFLDKCKEINHYWYLIARCLSTTGLRVHELLKITHEDILNETVLLVGKGGKPRRVFFQKSFISEFKEWFEESRKFVDEKFCPKTTRGVSQQIHAYARKAGLDVAKFHPHAFRHYFAKQYLKNNPTDIVGLQNLLGHSSIETTSIYLQRSYEEQLRDFHKNVNWL